MQDGADDERNKCVVCCKGFQKKSKLIIHMRSHTGEKPYTCNVCGKGFSVTSALNRHVRIHTGEKPFVCHICDQSFVDGCTLRRHILRHKGEKNYICKYCNKGYTTSTDLANHVRRHTAESSQVCGICNKNFLFRTDLKRHMSDVHLKIKPLTCVVCEKPFSHKYRLMIHQKIHTKDKNAEVEKPYGCLTCDKTFAERRHLMQHMKYHLPRQFNCPRCNKGFITQSKLNAHEKIHLRKLTASSSENKNVSENQVFIKEEADENCVKDKILNIKKETDVDSGVQENFSLGNVNVKEEVKSDAEVSDEDNAADSDYDHFDGEVREPPTLEDEDVDQSESMSRPTTMYDDVPINVISSVEVILSEGDANHHMGLNEYDPIA